MSNRILTFHQTAGGNPQRIGPTYYMEADYTPIAVRIYAVNAPTRDAQVDIYDDGVSIFTNNTPRIINQTTGKDETGAATTAAVLTKGQNSEDVAEDFGTTQIDKGSWVHCMLRDSGGGNNFTVQLELFSPDEPLEEEE